MLKQASCMYSTLLNSLLLSNLKFLNDYKVEEMFKIIYNLQMKTFLEQQAANRLFMMENQVILSAFVTYL